LEAVAAIARELGADALAAAQAREGAATSQGQGVAKGGQGQGIASGAISTREDAFATLARVADYFRYSEPHSPISYTLDELVSPRSYVAAGVAERIDHGHLATTELLCGRRHEAARRAAIVTVITVDGMKCC
jgi:predicted component of type VI protein secretion system